MLRVLQQSVLYVLQLGGVTEPNRQQCYLNAKGEYVESVNEVRTIISSTENYRNTNMVCPIHVCGVSKKRYSSFNFAITSKNIYFSMLRHEMYDA